MAAWRRRAVSSSRPSSDEGWLARDAAEWWLSPLMDPLACDGSRAAASPPSASPKWPPCTGTPRASRGGGGGGDGGGDAGGAPGAPKLEVREGAPGSGTATATPP